MLYLLIVSLLLQTPRNEAEVRKFERMTGYPNGRPGFVVDHSIPLCAGGADNVSNMRWEPIQESYVKDKYERFLCAEMKRQGYILVKK